MLLLPVSFLARGQGAFVYDQQSSTENLPGEAVVGITSFQQPVGQSFTPALSFVGFIRLQLLDGNAGNGSGATVYVNLRANSITGTVLAATSPVFIPDGFPGLNVVGYTNFFFPVPVLVTPGVQYYFQPVIQSGDGILAGRFVPNYLGGTEYINGQPGNNDLWFREGIVVPEPSVSFLLLLGGGVVAWRHRKKQRTG